MEGNKVKGVEETLNELLTRYPILVPCRDSIWDAYNVLLECYKADGKLIIAGNGGSAADSDHISGELTKSFMFKRAPGKELCNSLETLYGEEGKTLSASLEGGLAAIPLPTFNASNSAFANDVNWGASFAQLVNALGRKGDVFLGISTSGNSKDIVNAMMVAKASGLHVLALTGASGGRCKGMADICINVPENETFKIQELHLPVYHALCAMVEAALFKPL